MGRTRRRSYTSGPRTAVGSPPARSPGVRGDNARPAGQPRPHAPARRTRAAPLRPKGSGGKAPGAIARPRGGPRVPSPPPTSACTSPDKSWGRIPTSSSRVPPEPDPVTVLVSVLVLCSPSGFRLLMVRGVGWGWRGEGNAEGERGARPQRGGGKGRGERCAPGLRGGVAVGAARGGERQPPRRVGVTSSLAGAATEALGTGAEPERPPPPPFHCDPRVRPRRRRGAGAGTGLSWGPASPFPLPPCGLRGNVQPIPAAHCGLAPARAVARQPLAGLFPSLPCPFSLPLSSFPFPFSTTSF